MPNIFGFKFKVQRDGKRAYLFRDASQRVSICWSEKEGVFKTTYSGRAFQQELEKDYNYISFLEQLLKYMKAYKQDADKLQALHDAFQRIINE